MPATPRPESPPGGRRYWLFASASAVVGLAGLVLLDVVLGIVGLVPGGDGGDAAPIGSPFVEAGGVASIRREWVNEGRMYEFTEGERKGQYFLELGFRPASFGVPRAPGETLRIFALGASTTFGLGLDAGSAYPALLEERLRLGLAPDEEVEVINLGCPGCSSAHVAALARVALGYDPDLLLVYAGENEMLRPPRSAAIPVMRRMRSAVVAASSLAKWIDHALSLRARSSSSREATREDVQASRIEVHSVEAIGNGITEPPPRSVLDSIADAYSANLSRIIEGGRDLGVPVVLVAPISNLFWLPGGSALPSSFADTAAVLRRIDLALASASQGDVAAGRDLLQEAVELAPSFAEAWYHLGRAEIALGHLEAGRDALRQARDRDAWTHRPTSVLEERLSEVARAHHVPLVDARHDFESVRTQDEVDRLFLDHVHPTAEGHRLLVDAITPVVASTLRH